MKAILLAILLSGCSEAAWVKVGEIAGQAIIAKAGSGNSYNYRQELQNSQNYTSRFMEQSNQQYQQMQTNGMLRELIQMKQNNLGNPQ